MIKEIDITKMKPLNWQWLLILFITIIMALLVWSGAVWAKNKIVGLAPVQKAKEAVI